MSNFLSELSRRNVFRVAAAYVIVGWILLQVASIAAPAMHLPDWAVSLVLYILLIGFPLAMLLTWAFEVTPDGIRKTEAPEAGLFQGVRHIDYGLIVIGLLIVGATALMPGRGPVPEPATGETAPGGIIPTFSFAALPLDNLSDDPRLNFIADGLSEDIITRMATDTWFKVAARNASFGYRNKDKDFARIGQELGIRYVLEGSLRTIGETVRVTVQLIDTETSAHIWADKIDAPLEAFLLGQDQIITRLVADIFGVVNTSAQSQLSIEDMTDLAINDQLALISNTLFEFRLDAAEEALDILLRQDPNNAVAHGQMAFVISGRNRFSGGDPLEVDAEVQNWIAKAVQLAPGNPLVLGFVTDACQFTNRFEDGLIYAERAVRLAPHNSYGWNVRSEVKLGLGLYEEALEESKTTMALQGERSAGFYFQESVAATALIGLQRFAEAETFARSSASRNPEARNLLALVVALAHQGKIEAATREAQRLVKDDTFPDIATLMRDIRNYNRSQEFIDTVIEGLELAGLTEED